MRIYDQSLQLKNNNFFFFKNKFQVIKRVTTNRLTFHGYNVSLVVFHAFIYIILLANTYILIENVP